MSEPVVTRFAPSPTGFLHIGGGRTALFNWLYARRFGGKMLLRIEDTDRERSTEAAIAAIIDGLNWLGLSWDGDIVYQFTRAARHREIAEQLLAEGKAYRCYASPEELTAKREAARKEGRGKLYDGRWRDRDPSEAPADVKPVIRLKAPQTGETVIEDQVQGRVVWQNSDLDDLVLSPDLDASQVEEWNSLNHIRLLVAIEREFGIKFTSEEMTSMKNVGELAEVIAGKLT